MTAATEVLAIDVGGTKLAAARVKGDSILGTKRCPTPRSGDPAELVATLAGLLGDWADGTMPLGIATTGLVRGGRVEAVNPVTLPLPYAFPLQDALLTAIGPRSAVMVNDAHAAAWGEHRFGAGRGAGSMLFMTVSTGIGGGCVIGGRLVTGAGGFAGHIGHVSADPAGPECGCGRRGCLEALASGTALAAATKQAGLAMTLPELFAAAAEEEAALRIIEGTTEAVARCVADLKATLDIDRVVIGGGVGLAAGYLDHLRRSLHRVAPPRFRPDVAAAACGAEAGLLGVADLVAGDNLQLLRHY